MWGRGLSSNESVPWGITPIPRSVASSGRSWIAGGPRSGTSSRSILLIWAGSRAHGTRSQAT
eukprot:14423015-Alexandrium_andersonii.AAC.1